MRKKYRAWGALAVIFIQIAAVAPALAAAPSNVIWKAHNDGISGGVISGVVVDPSSSSTVYALTQGSGVYKSTDAGANWSAVNTGLPADKTVGSSNLFGNQLTIDPANPSRLYASFGGKPFKTVNGGSSWSEISTGIDDCGGSYDIAGVAVDPQNSNHLFAGYIASGCIGGLYESTDAGSSWSRVLANGIGNDAWTLAFDPASSTRLYINTVHVGVARSTDGGLTWTNTSPTSGDVSGSAIVVHPTSTDRVFMGYQDSSGNTGLYVSTDGGLTWTSKASEVPGMPQDIRFSSSSPAIGYAATSEGVFKTTNGGMAWAELGDHGAKAPKSLALNPLDPSIVYMGTNGGGMYKSTDGGSTFSAINTGLPVSITPAAIAIAPSQPTTYYATVSGVGFFRSTDRGYTWTKRSSSVSTVNASNYIAISPTDPNVIYAGFDQVYKSTDGGSNWTSMNLDPSNTHWFQSAAVDPSNADVVMVADSNTLKAWRSADAGTNWATSTTLLPASYFYRLVFDPSSSTNVYAATYDYVWRSSDNGLNWSRASTSMAGNPSIDTLAVAPDSGVVYAGATTDKIFKSVDHGATWATTTYASTPGGTSPAAIRATNGGAAYAFTLYGWKGSSDAGDNWTSIPTTSFSASIFLPKFSFQLDPLDTGRFLVGGFGNGVNIYEDYKPVFGVSSTLEYADVNGAPVSGGDTFTVTTTVANSGTAPAESTILHVEVPSGLQYVSGSSRVAGSAVGDPASTQNLTFNIGTLLRNQRADVSFQVSLLRNGPAMDFRVTSAEDVSGTDLGSIRIFSADLGGGGGGGGGGSSHSENSSSSTPASPATSTPSTLPVSSSTASSTPPAPGSPEALRAQIADLMAQIAALRAKLGLPATTLPGGPSVIAQLAFTRDLQTGDTGADVKALQAFLNGHGFQVAASGPGSPGAETERFGVLTRQALSKFQAANGISPAAGYFGPKTRAAVNATLGG